MISGDSKATNIPHLNRKLYEEFSQIALYYAKAKELLTHKVIIEIADLNTVWGQYDPSTHCVRLSRRLVENYPWWTIIGVLKHELAHHLVHLRYKVDIKAHGPEFQRACQDLGVPQYFRSAGVDLSEDQSSWDPKFYGDAESLRKASRDGLDCKSEAENAVVQKIKKLLSLACSDNEFEAARASEKIQELLLKNQLRGSGPTDAETISSSNHHQVGVNRLSQNEEKFQDFGSESSFEHVIIDLGSKRVPLYIKLIIQNLVDHFFVFAVFQKSNETSIVEIIGTRSNLLMADYAYMFLREQVESEIKVKRRQGMSGTQLKSFAWGYLEGFSEQMRKQKQAAMDRESANGLQQPNGTAVVIRVDQFLIKRQKELDDYVKIIFPRLRKTGQKQRFDSGSYQEGHKAGSELKFRKALGGASQKFGQLLGFKG